MYYIYGISGSFLLIESTDSMIMTMNRMTKKAALGGPSSDDTFPLREKPSSKFYCWQQQATQHISSLAPSYDGMTSMIDPALH